MPTIVPRYFRLDLSKHVMRNVSRFRLRVHALKVEGFDYSTVVENDPTTILNTIRTILPNKNNSNSNTMMTIRV